MCKVSGSFLRHLPRCPVNPRAVLNGDILDAQDITQSEPQLAGFPTAGAVGEDVVPPLKRSGEVSKFRLGGERK